MRVWGSLAVLTVLCLTGCGEREVEPPRPRVLLLMDGPDDRSTVSDATVEVTGRVTPASAVVLVDGTTVTPSGSGSFSTTVALDEGINVIDVAAGADRRPGAALALRVTRDSRVTIPTDIVGRPEDEAFQTLSDLGLDVRTEDTDVLGLLPRLGTGYVCTSRPDPGTAVPPQSEVTLEVSRDC